jgi:CotH kinase protein
MAETLDHAQFGDLFKQRLVVLDDIPARPSRDLAAEVNEAEGRGDGTLRTEAEFAALFDRLAAGSLSPGVLILSDDSGQTQVGKAVEDYRAASRGKQEFFDQAMYLVDVTGWPADQMQPEDPVEAPAGARLGLWATDPRDARHLPPAGREGVLLATTTFSLMNSGNRTLRAPKRSWKVDFEPGDDDDKLVGMERLNLKSMYNDPSQMREALAWALFGRIGIPAARHTYAKLGINGGYRGLFSLIEQVDKRFLKDWFGKNSRGNLYKAYCGDRGCATLERRFGPDGDDSGRQYFTPGHPDLTYRLKTNEDDPAANTYDDLARFIRTIDGAGLGSDEGRFRSDQFRESVEGILNVRAFLRWASANLLLGSWDNYFATPANYYLYNSGRRGHEEGFAGSPYFTFIPWDYDNSFGIDYVGTQWQYTDVVDWPSNTLQYWNGKHTSRIPLVQNLLANPDFLAYYLDHLEYLLDTEFTIEKVVARMGTSGGDGLWHRISQAAYLESDTPHGQPFTGRQFTNDQVYRTGVEQNELRQGQARVEGIVHYVRMRHDRAREQLAKLRTDLPPGSSGASFPVPLERLPERV